MYVPCMYIHIHIYIYIYMYIYIHTCNNSYILCDYTVERIRTNGLETPSWVTSGAARLHGRLEAGGRLSGGWEGGSPCRQVLQGPLGLACRFVARQQAGSIAQWNSEKQFPSGCRRNFLMFATGGSPSRDRRRVWPASTAAMLQVRRLCPSGASAA